MRLASRIIPTYLAFVGRDSLASLQITPPEKTKAAGKRRTPKLCAVIIVLVCRAASATAPGEPNRSEPAERYRPPRRRRAIRPRRGAPWGRGLRRRRRWQIPWGRSRRSRRLQSAVWGASDERRRR